MNRENQQHAMAGEKLAHAFMPWIKAHEPEDYDGKLVYWALFLSHIFGQCSAAIGPTALRVIGDQLEAATKQAVSEKVN